MIKVWLAFSACWIGFWSWYYRIPFCGPLHPGEDAHIGWHCDGPASEASGYEIVPLIVLLAVVIGIPIAVLLLGVAIRLLAFKDEGSNTNSSTK